MNSRSAKSCASSIVPLASSVANSHKTSKQPHPRNHAHHKSTVQSKVEK